MIVKNVAVKVEWKEDQKVTWVGGVKLWMNYFKGNLVQLLELIPIWTGTEWDNEVEATDTVRAVKKFVV